MVFDTIMGVGRTSQITQDVILNPYSIYNEDIAKSSSVTLVNGPTIVDTGNEKNMIDPDYPSTSIAYQVQDTNMQIIFDFQKFMYFKESSLIFDFINATVPSTYELRFDISKDAINWQTMASQAFTDASPAVSGQLFKINYFRCRFIRVIIVRLTGTGVMRVAFYKLKAFLESLQY